MIKPLWTVRKMIETHTVGCGNTVKCQLADTLGEDPIMCANPADHPLHLHDQ